MDRRRFLALSSSLAAAGLPAFGQNGRLRTSLAEWSLHKAIQSRQLLNLDFPMVAKEHFGISGLEFVNQLWEAPTQAYITRLKNNMKKFETQGVLIMCDGEGMMGHSVKAERIKSADLHRKWVDYAAELGCHSIRTNMYPDKAPNTSNEVDEFLKCCVESFTRLCEYGKANNINIIIENHGGISSNPDVVARLMKMVNLPNFGTLPDFGNFPKETDKYEAVGKLMPFAKGVSFKCHDFGPDGKESLMDMDRMMKVVLDSGFKGWVGIEYEGTRLSEFMGVQAAKRFLDRYTA